MYLAFSSPAQIVAELRAASVDGHTLWLLCVADCHGADIPALLDACRNSDLRVCGGLFPGLIDGRATRSSGIIAIPLPSASQINVTDLAAGSVAWQRPLPEIADGAPASAMIFVDCLAPGIASLLEDIYDHYGQTIGCVGAGAGYHDLRAAASIFTGQGMLTRAALLVIAPQNAAVGVRHGWKRVHGPFVASRSEGRTIRSFNWEPAGAFYRACIERQNPDYVGRPVFPDLAEFYPLCIGKEGAEDVIRDPVRVTEADEIVVLSDVRENSVMYLAHGDHASLIEAASLAVEDCGMPQGVERCFVSDCYSRTLMLDGLFAQELDAVCQAVARRTSATPEGVLAFGEIASSGKQRLEFFNKTVVVALMQGAAHVIDRN